MTHIDADVVIVGAGPAGSTAAAHLAQAGFEVALLEKASFPRDKICGDALTPRAVRETQRLGIPTRAEDGWHPNRGLRLIGAGHRLEIDWPDVPGMPDHGLTRPRMKLDADLAGFAAACGARLHENMMATHPLLGPDGWVTGVAARATDERGRRTGPELTFRAPVVIAADGAMKLMSAATASGTPIEWPPPRTSDAVGFFMPAISSAIPSPASTSPPTVLSSMSSPFISGASSTAAKSGITCSYLVVFVSSGRI